MRHGLIADSACLADPGHEMAVCSIRFVIRPVGCMDSAKDCKSTKLSDQLIEFQFHLPAGVKPAACWPGPSLLSMALGNAILWAVLAALSARFGIHFAALFRRKQAKEKLHAAILQHVLVMKRLQGEQAEPASERPKRVSAVASRNASRPSLGNIEADFQRRKAAPPAAPKQGSPQQTRRQGISSLLADGAAVPTQEVRVSRPSVIVYIIRSVQFVGLSYSICALQTKEMWKQYLDVANYIDVFNLRIQTPEWADAVFPMTALLRDCRPEPVTLWGQANAGIGEIFAGRCTSCAKHCISKLARARCA